MAVLEAAESRGPAVVGLNDGTIVATLLAAAHPGRLFAVIPGPPS